MARSVGGAAGYVQWAQFWTGFIPSPRLVFYTIRRYVYEQSRTLGTRAIYDSDP